MPYKKEALLLSAGLHTFYLRSTSTHIYIEMYLCISIDTYIYDYIYMTYIGRSACIYLYRCRCVCILVYLYIYMFVYRQLVGLAGVSMVWICVCREDRLLRESFPEYFTRITEVLQSVPREFILLLKTNDLVSTSPLFLSLSFIPSFFFFLLFLSVGFFPSASSSSCRGVWKIPRHARPVYAQLDVVVGEEELHD